MEKKNYIKPELQVVTIEEQSAILSQSDPINKIGTSDETMGDNEVIYSGGYTNIWDDTDED